eukprot:gene6718-9211_t
MRIQDIVERLLLISINCLLAIILADAPPGSVPMRLVNYAGSPIELFWIDTFNGPNVQLVKQTTKPIRNNSETHINSYDTHQFSVKFLHDIPGISANFTKGPKDETMYVSYDPENGMSIKITTKFNEIMDQINDAAKVCADLTGDKFSACIANAIVEDVTRITEAKTTMSKYRDLMSSRLRNYTCIDENMNTTTPIASTDVELEESGVYTLDSFLDTPHAKIWKVDDFVTDEECDILMKHGKPRLERATVAAEDGTSVVSEHRKAQQASYTMNGENDLLWPLYNRAMGMVNMHTHMSLTPQGQEEFTIIQYNPDDQYTPHCDGSCDNSMHVKYGRVATALIYCKVPEKGGATTFTKADVYIRPVKGTATFFSYKGPDGRMDDGYTEHSGCPVIQGEKWVITMWMREGVDNEHPWSKYDPSGLEILESDS